MKSLYKARIYHKRFLPVGNEFLYRGYFIRFDLDEVQHLRSPLFGVDSFNLFSFYSKDHGDRAGGNLRLWAKDKLEKAGISNFNGRIELQTFPRVLGFVFNPVSFWYCYQEKKLRAIICEVNNTFGETHQYVLRNEKQELPKEFHVSPFYEVRGSYYFDFRQQNKAVINYHFDGSLQLTTVLKGDEELPWRSKSFIKLFFGYPLYTVYVVFLIHYQALKLWRKKINFFSKPEPKKENLTYFSEGQN